MGHVACAMRHEAWGTGMCVSPYLRECAIKAAYNNDKKLHVFITNCNCTNFIHGRRHIAILLILLHVVAIAIAIVVVLVASCHIPEPAAAPAKSSRKKEPEEEYIGGGKSWR